MGLTVCLAFSCGIVCFVVSGWCASNIAGDEILYMFSVFKYSKLVVWKFTKFDINSNISFKSSTVWKWIYSNGHNGILMRVSNQNIVSGLTLQQLPSIVYCYMYAYQQVMSWHACRIIPSSTMFGQLQNWNIFSNITCFKVFEPNPDWNWHYGRSIAVCATTISRATLMLLLV